mgnify:CR=1 FL=1
MKELTAEQIQENWSKLRSLMTDTFEGERLENLNKMYDYFEERMCIAPASGKEHYHYCHVGGYVEHILHIIQFSLQLKDLWEKNGANIDFSEEELVFAALHHDLGKVGDLAEDYYKVQDNTWFIKNRGEYYKHNDNLQYMTVTDRALYLLQHFGIKMSEKEYLGLKLTDGLYEEANKSYYIGYSPGRSLKTNIAYILHQADMMATHIEGDEWKRADEEVSNKFKKAVVTEEKPKPSEKLSEKSQDLFDELFGDK